MPIAINPSAISISQNGTVQIEESSLASFVASSSKKGISPMLAANPQCANDGCANDRCTGSNSACGNGGCG